MFSSVNRLIGARFLCLKHNSIPSLSSIIINRNVVHKTTDAMEPLEEQGRKPEKFKKWLSYNNKIYEPTKLDEEPRPAFVCHAKYNVKYSPKKMWYIACFVRGMSVDEAIRQLNFVCRKGALMVSEAILEAQQLAVENHNVEFKSNLWVAESFVSKGYVIKGIRKHTKGRYGRVEYKYCNYHVRLEEGQPPENYYNKPSQDKDTLLSNYMRQMRARNVINSL